MEFPSDKLKLMQQIGQGAFGDVFLAEAEGILEDQVTTMVAVKRVAGRMSMTNVISIRILNNSKMT